MSQAEWTRKKHRLEQLHFPSRNGAQKPTPNSLFPRHLDQAKGQFREQDDLQPLELVAEGREEKIIFCSRVQDRDRGFQENCICHCLSSFFVFRGQRFSSRHHRE